ncbi:Os09g0443000 [Oryza sativa Japonica Group]|uniref:Os09g0443000 protein n=1 Tax=Oryza sativa subsp. japonica TaxID=39947 RepID=A0A0P0XNQ3_ORYSJ|nr:hypothetical protein EE612_048143 [Oryza sativa]BAT08316.1 Os09g0443000 [Oryza sativa Japonica Group]
MISPARRECSFPALFFPSPPSCAPFCSTASAERVHCLETAGGMEPPPPPHRHKKCRTAEAAVPGGEEEEEAKDALISLPPDVLDGVLTRLGLRDAVRTSALSRAWRRRWESLPSLDISFPFPHQEGAALAAVDGVLLRCLPRPRPELQRIRRQAHHPPRP